MPEQWCSYGHTHRAWVIDVQHVEDAEPFTRRLAIGCAPVRCHVPELWSAATDPPVLLRKRSAAPLGPLHAEDSLHAAHGSVCGLVRVFPHAAWWTVAMMVGVGQPRPSPVILL